MTLFEVHETQILEELPDFFNIVLSQFVRQREEGSSSSFYADSVTRTLLKVALSVSTFFYKFLGTEMI